MFCDRFDVNTFEYQMPKEKTKYPIIPVTTKRGSTDWADRIRFQMSEDENTNLQRAVWGIQSFENATEPKRTLELTIESPVLLHFLQALDEKNVEEAYNNQQKWFKSTSDLSREQIKSMYIPIVKDPFREGEPYTVKVKVKVANEYPTKVNAVIENCDGEIRYQSATHEALQKGVRCLALVETTGLWFRKPQFGMSFTVNDVFVWSKPQNVQSFSFSPGTIARQIDSNIQEDEAMESE